MSVYSAPLDDMRFTLREIVGFDKIAALPGFDGTDQELTDQILEEAGKFSRDVLAPLNEVGDKEKARLDFRMPTASSGRVAGTPCRSRKNSAARICRSP